LKKYAKHAN